MKTANKMSGVANPHTFHKAAFRLQVQCTAKACSQGRRGRGEEGREEGKSSKGGTWGKEM